MRRQFSGTLLVPMMLVAMVPIACSSDSSKPKLGKVSGTVMYNGKPLTAGEVVFTPLSGKGGESGQVAAGHIQADGSYSLTTFDTDDGAILGQHAVTVILREGTSDASFKSKVTKEGTGRIRYILPKSVVPEKYSKVDSTPFRYTVEASGNTINLELKD
jgi:hypothetical protein